MGTVPSGIRSRRQIDSAAAKIFVSKCPARTSCPKVARKKKLEIPSLSEFDGGVIRPGTPNGVTAGLTLAGRSLAVNPVKDAESRQPEEVPEVGSPEPTVTLRALGRDLDLSARTPCARRRA
jgi:hypothetical protein